MMKLKDALEVILKNNNKETKWFKELALNANMDHEYLAACILLKAIKEFSDEARVYKIYGVKTPKNKFAKNLAVLKLCKITDNFPDIVEPQMGDPLIATPNSFQDEKNES